MITETYSTFSSEVGLKSGNPTLLFFSLDVVGEIVVFFYTTYVVTDQL